MPNKTQEYRKAQLDKVVSHGTYYTTLRIAGGEQGETNTLNITKDEFEAIKALLLGNRRVFVLKSMYEDMGISGVFTTRAGAEQELSNFGSPDEYEIDEHSLY